MSVAVIASRLPSLTEAISGLLTVLSAGGDGRLRVTGRSRHGFGERELFIPAGARDWIDVPLLELLEDDSWALRIGLAVLHPSSSAVIRLAALSASWRIPRVFKNPDNPESECGRQWIVDEEQVGAAYQALDQFSLPPSIIIEGASIIEGTGRSLEAAWALAEPVEFRTTADVDQVQEHRRFLAKALGVEVPDENEDLGAVFLSLPGSIVREAPYTDLVTCALLDRSRKYTIDRISAAGGRKEKR